MQVVSIVNLKGGVGKTTTAVNLAYELAVRHGRRVLLIDADHQGNASKFYGADAAKGSLADLMEGQDYIKLVQPTSYRNLDILPSDMGLLSADLSLVAAGASCRNCLPDLRAAVQADNRYDCIKAAAEIAEHQAEQQREDKRKADEVYQNSEYRRTQLCILDWAKDKRLDDQSILPSAVCQTVRSLRGISNPTRRTWMPALDDLFGLADALHITLSDLLGLAPELPPYTSEWHRYPLDKPQDGQTVLCRYGTSSFDLLVYQSGEFGKITAGDFVSLPFDVKYWTSAYPEG